MESAGRRVEKYLNRAKKIRSLAWDVRGADARRFLLAIARDYEKMAAPIESRGTIPTKI
jgi:hypothetical protein